VSAKRLVDTSAWIEVLRTQGDPAIRHEVAETTREGRAVTCEMVLLELWAGAGGSREQAMIARLEADLEILPIDAAVWRKAAALARSCRAAGVTAPVTDLLIAACASHHGVVLLERDGHFAQIAGACAKTRK
jgi:predicted nucleic acid-binding protein